jgi:hypothetical protein
MSNDLCKYENGGLRALHHYVAAICLMLLVGSCQRSSNDVRITVLGEDTSNFTAMENLKSKHE